MRRRSGSAVRAPILVLAAVLLLGTAPLAVRASAQSLEDRLNENRRKQRETTAEIEQAKAALVDIGAQRRQLELSIRQIGSEIGAATERLERAEAEVQQYALAALALSVQMQIIQQRIEEARAATKQSAVLLYRRADKGAMLDLLRSTEGAGSFVGGSHYLKRVSGKRQSDLKKVGVLRAELAVQEAQLAATRQRADEARDRAAAEKQAMEALYRRQEQALTGAQIAETAYRTKQAEAAAKQAELTAEFQAISNEIAAQLRSLGANTPAYGNGPFIPPVGRVPISSGFGYRTDPITGQQAFHAGVDFSASCGTPIRAAERAVVFSAGYNGGYGNVIVLNHGAGLATVYAHQSSFAASTGQAVEQGQVIGYVGSTGKSTGCHLHFEVRVNGNPVDPMGYL